MTQLGLAYGFMLNNASPGKGEVRLGRTAE